MLARFVRFFASVRLTIVLLIILAVVMVIGTVIPQNQDHSHYTILYGQTLARILESVQFTEIFHSYLFICLLTLFSANTLVCSLKRLKYLKRILFSPKVKVGEDFFASLRIRDEFTATQGEVKYGVDQVRSYLTGRGYGELKKSKEKSKFFLFQKGKWGRTGPELVHFSILIILLGGIIGGIFGFSSHISIPEGRSLPVPGINYSIKLNDFTVDYYPDKFSLSLYKSAGGEYKFVKKMVFSSGEKKSYRELTLKINMPSGKNASINRKLRLEASQGGETEVVDIVRNNQRIMLAGNYAAIFRYFIKEYTSQVEIINEAGEIQKSDNIRVNHPLKYGGINFYQQSYKEGVAEVRDADWVVLEAYPNSSFDSELLWKKKVEIGQKIKLSKNLFVTPTKFFPSLVVDKEGEVKNESNALNNPAIYLQFFRTESDNSSLSPLNRWVFEKFGDVHYRRIAQAEPRMPRLELVDFGPVIKTGDISILKVSSLPGLELIYSGFGLLMIGLVLSFYVFHKRIWILIDEESGKLQVGGKCNKQVKSFDSEMEKVFEIARDRNKGGSVHE